LQWPCSCPCCATIVWGLLSPAEDFPQKPLYVSNLARTLTNLASALQAAGKLPEADDAYRQAVRLAEKLVEQYPTSPAYQSDLGASQNNLADFLLGQGQPAAARQLLEQAILHQQVALSAVPKHPEYRKFLGNHYRNLAEAALGLRDHAAAVEAALELPRLLPDDWEEYHRAATLLARAIPLAATDMSLTEQKRSELAEAYAVRAVQVLRQAIAKGLKDAGRLQEPQLFQTLSSREDFQRLFADLSPGRR